MASGPNVYCLEAFDPSVFETEESFRELAQIHFNSARDLYAKRGTLAAMTCNYCLRDPVTRARGPVLYVISMEGYAATRENKQRLAIATRATCQMGEAVCSVLVSEVCSVRAKDEEDAERIKTIGHLSHHPDKMVGLMVRLDHPRWFAVGLAPVGTNGIGSWKVSYDPKAYQGNDLFRVVG